MSSIIPPKSTPDETYLEALKILSQHYGKTYQSGERIIREEEPGNEIYFIVKGAVNVYIGKGHAKRELWTLVTGDIFGELALLDELSRTATVEAANTTELVVLERELFYELIGKHPILGRKVIELMGKRMRKMDTQFKIELGYIKGQQMGQQL